MARVHVGHVGPATPLPHPLPLADRPLEGDVPQISIDSDDDSGTDIDIINTIRLRRPSSKSSGQSSRFSKHSLRSSEQSSNADNAWMRGEIVDDYDFVERIELLELPSVQEGMTRGHRLTAVQLSAPTWCDQCGDFIWGVYKQCLTCDNCQYTCHHKCRPLISVDCQSPDGQQGAAAAVDELTTCDGQEKAQTDDADSGYHTGGSTLRAVAAAARSSGATTAAVTPPPSSAPTDICATREDLREKIQAFNNNNHGLIMTLASDEGTMTFQGFIRVYLNLIHPVNMSLSMETEQGETTQMTSFYLPKNTSKVVHINSDTSIQEVISALLSKFKITDNPRKYVLYEQITGKDNKATMHKLNEGDRPLPLCLSWTAEGLDVHKFVLHENDTGEIMWEAFSLPELENFLKILNREESEYIKQLKARYNLAKIQIQMALKDMPQPADQREPVYV